MSKNPLRWILWEVEGAKRRLPIIKYRINEYRRLSVSGIAIDIKTMRIYRNTHDLWEPLKPHKKGFFSRAIKHLRKLYN